MKGSIELRQIDFPTLRGNPLRDSDRRLTPIYLPPGYVEEDRRYPSVYFLHGFLGTSMAWLNVSPFAPTVIDRLDDLIVREAISPVIGVFPDGWTSLGGSQWINSDAIGRYRDAVVQDLVPYIDRQFRTIRTANSRAIVGKSSGGYGVFVMGCQHPEVFGHIAAHSADSYFEYCFLSEFPKAASALKTDGPEKWFTEFRKRVRETKMKNEDFPIINTIAMAAAFSPKLGEPLNLELPFDLCTAKVRPAIWERWLKNDPVRFVPQSGSTLRKLQSIFIDCGARDEFNLQWGTRMLANELKAAGIGHIHEEFEDGHLGTSYRYDRSLQYLVPRMR